MFEDTKKSGSVSETEPLFYLFLSDEANYHFTLTNPCDYKGAGK